MDTSKEYIKMCDCPEIKNIQSFLGDEVNVFYDSQKGIHYGFPTASSIWLPRQDQIQDMLGFGKYPYVELQQFYKTMCGGKCSNPPSLKSFEQLWLTFFMHKKHNKIWTGKAWL